MGGRKCQRFFTNKRRAIAPARAVDKWRDERWGKKNKKTHSRDCGRVFVDAFSSAVVDRAEGTGTSEEKREERSEDRPFLFILCQLYLYEFIVEMKKMREIFSVFLIKFINSLVAIAVPI
jgi:hypothetical protein